MWPLRQSCPHYAIAHSVWSASQKGHCGFKRKEREIIEENNEKINKFNYKCIQQWSCRDILPISRWEQAPEPD